MSVPRVMIELHPKKDDSGKRIGYTISVQGGWTDSEGSIVQLLSPFQILSMLKNAEAFVIQQAPFEPPSAIQTVPATALKDLPKVLN